MTNTKAQVEIIEIQATETVKGTVLTIKERPTINDKPIVGGGINESKEENTIFNASIIYEF